MKRFRNVNMKDMPAWRISSMALYAMVSVIAVIYMLFYFVGYNNYDYEYPMFKAPVFTDTLMWFLYIMITLTVVVIIISAARNLKPGIQRQKTENGVPVAKIAYGTIGFLLLCLIITFIAGSQDALVINGKKYTDGFWLKTADMFIYTITTLLVMAVLLVAFGLSGYGKKYKQKKKENVQAQEA